MGRILAFTQLIILTQSITLLKRSNVIPPHHRRDLVKAGQHAPYYDNVADDNPHPPHTPPLTPRLVNSPMTHPKTTRNSSTMAPVRSSTRSLLKGSNSQHDPPCSGMWKRVVYHLHPEDRDAYRPHYGPHYLGIQVMISGYRRGRFHYIGGISGLWWWGGGYGNHVQVSTTKMLSIVGGRRLATSVIGDGSAT